jgi:hypothetical protein
MAALLSRAGGVPEVCADAVAVVNAPASKTIASCRIIDSSLVAV